MEKAPDAYRTISEVADDLGIQQHVLRFWESRFSQIRPLKRGGGRRYYRPDDVELLKGIRHLLYKEGYTIKGVQRILKEHGIRAVQDVTRGAGPADLGGADLSGYDDAGLTGITVPVRPAGTDAPIESRAEPAAVAPVAGAAAGFEIAAPRAEAPLSAAMPDVVSVAMPAPVFTVTTPDPRERGQVAMFRGALQRGETGMGVGSSLEFAARMRENGAAPARAVPAPSPTPLQAALDELLACRAEIEALRSLR